MSNRPQRPSSSTSPTVGELTLAPTHGAPLPNHFFTGVRRSYPTPIPNEVRSRPRWESVSEVAKVKKGRGIRTGVGYERRGELNWNSRVQGL
jgi:hypothetical protein